MDPVPPVETPVETPVGLEHVDTEEKSKKIEVSSRGLVRESRRSRSVPKRRARKTLKIRRTRGFRSRADRFRRKHGAFTLLIPGISGRVRGAQRNGRRLQLVFSFVSFHDGQEPGELVTAYSLPSWIVSGEDCRASEEEGREGAEGDVCGVRAEGQW